MEPPPAQELHHLDSKNPWPGLAAYDEASQNFFHGRIEDVADLLRSIRQTPLTVLYGKSGLGKSSLLQAGLFPKLRQEHFLPVYLHVDFSKMADPSPFEQAAQRLEEAIDKSEAHCPRREPGEDLWQYLHRRDLGIWAKDVFPLTPVLVFDQFEALFSSNRRNRNHIQSVLDSLADLIQNCIPSELAVDTSDAANRERLDMFSQHYRVVLALREDFLPEINNWKDRIPSKMSNWFRLLPMSREQAIAATQKAGEEILEEGVAARIVNFVANAKDEAYDSKKAVALEPVLLSLCCYQLNLKRIQTHAEKIDATLVAHSGLNILEAFYHEAIRGMPENVPLFIENNLIQGNDRGSYSLKGALDENLIQEDDLNTLIGRFRLLRVNQQADATRIELIHDRLVSVVRQSRDKRLAEAREQKEKQLRRNAEFEARKESERREQAEQDRSRMRKMRNRLFIAVLGLVVLVGITAIQAKNAKDQGLRVTVMRLVAEAQAMFSGARIDSEEQAFFQLLAAFHILPNKDSSAGILDALIKYQSLVKLMMTGSPVLAVAFSPDGSRIVSGSRGQSFRLWNAVTGEPIGEPLQGHKNSVSCAAFSPDGSRIVSGSGDNTLHIWDANTGGAIGEPMHGHTDRVESVAFSPDGSRIVSGSWDKTLRLWNAVTSGAIGEPMHGHTDSVSCVSFNFDGSRIISGSWDKTLRLWNAVTGKQIGEPLQGHKDSVLSVAFNRDGSRIVSGSKDKTLRLWNAVTGEPIGEPLQGHKNSVSCAAFSPDGSRIVSGSWDKTLRLWNAANGKSIGWPQLAHKLGVNSVAFSPDGRRIVSGSQDGFLRMWDATFNMPLQGHTDWVNSVAFSPDGSRIVSGSGDDTLRTWDANTGKAIGEPMHGHTDRVESVAFSPDGSRIVSGSKDKTLRLWNAVTGKQIGEPLQKHTEPVSCVAFSPDGSRIVSGSKDKTLRLWNAVTGEPIGEPLQGHKDSVTCAAFKFDGSRIVSGSGDKTLRIWDATTGQPIGDPMKGHEEGVNSAAFNRDGSRIASGSWDKTIRLWDAETHQPIRKPLKGHEDSVMSVAFSPGEIYIVSGSWDSTLRLWDITRENPLGLPLIGHDGMVQSVAFNHDGTRIVSGSGDNTLRQWPVPTNLPEELCKKLTRNMSRREWRDWVSPDIGYEIQCPGLPIPQDKS